MREPSIRRARPLLGTVVEIAASGSAAQAAVKAAFAAVERVQSLMSYHNPASDVSRINREAAARAVPVHPWTWEVLAAARKYSAASGGLFDITVAPVLVRLGYLPRPNGFPCGSAQGDWRDMELLSCFRVRLRRRLLIDLGGIAKGFAVDRAIAVLRERGVSAGCVNAGGDLRRFGPGSQTLHVRHPTAPAVLLPIEGLGEGAAATSAGYFSARRMQGEWVTPHIHPLTRRALPPGHSVTVLANDCMTADALTKIVLADWSAAPPLLEHFGARAMLLDPHPCASAWRPWDSAQQERRCA